MQTVTRKMAPIELTIPELHLHNFRRLPKDGNWRKENAAMADLQLGHCLVIANIGFAENDHSPGFYQYWGWTRPVVETTQLWKHQFPEISDPLGNFLAKAVYDFVFVEKAEEVLALIQGQTETLELPIFWPPDWKGKNLVIPINSVTATTFGYQYRNSKTACCIHLDRHFYYYEVPIYDGHRWSFHEKGILSPGINNTISDLLAKANLRRCARQIYRTEQHIDPGNRSFICCTKDHDPKGPFSSIRLE